MSEEKKEIKKEENKKQEAKKETKVEKVETPKKETKKEEKPKVENKEPKVETKKEETKKFETKTNTSKKKPSKNSNKKTTWPAIATVIAVVVVAAILTIMIVTSSNPKKSVDGLFSNLKEGDFKSAQEFISGDNLVDNTEFSEETQKLLFDKLEWKVKKVTEENDKATIEVEVINKDFKTIISNYMQKALKAAFGGDNVSEEQIEGYFSEELKNDQVQTTTTTKTIQAVKEDKKWKVVSNDELTDVLLPGLEEAINSLS